MIKFFLGLLTQKTLEAKLNLKNLTQTVLSELGTTIPAFMAEEVMFCPLSLQMGFAF